MTVMVIALLVPSELLAETGAGNADTGRAYYTGSKRFKNGGPPCISCHNAGTPGALGGGSLGPDLTKVMETKFFLIDANWINSEGVPVMGAIFPKRNVTPEEVEHLKAFLTEASQEQKAQGAGKFIGGGVIGTIILLIIIAGIWSNRYRSRCKGTAHEALWRNYGGKGGR